MRIEVLYFDGCPSHERLLPRLRELLDQAGVDDPVALVRVESGDDAERQRFLGSPTLRIDGEDVDPTAGERTDYGLKCRLYRTSEGQQPVPADEWMRAAIDAPETPHTPMSDTASCAPRMGYCTSSQAPVGPINGRQRAARASAGAALVALAAAAARAPRPLDALVGSVAGWVGVSHLAAAATGYNGCPELGAIPSIVLGRAVHTRCGPWQAIDRRLRLIEAPEAAHV